MGREGSDRRVFLLLQGPMSFFFAELGAALRAAGADVLKVCVCPGDRLFWRGGGVRHFRGRAEAWTGWLDDLIAAEGVTDIACLGDGRRWHDEALPVARKRGVRIHVVEQGYLRPHFLTVEPEGTGGRTRFPRDWAGIEALSGGEVAAPRFETSFLNFSIMDVGFQLANVLTSWLLYPHYRQHMLDPPLKEWAGWILWKALPLRRRRKGRDRAVARIDAHQGPLFVFPLQLETDFQIRLHGPPEGLRAALTSLVASFASHAPDRALLVVKLHPLDNGWTPWPRLVAEAAEAAGAADRVVYLDGGDLDGMLVRASGVVVVNSTVGLTALKAGAPVKALGTAIYDLVGLCFQGPLDEFWAGGRPADPARLATFLSALAHAIQVPGGFDGSGVKPGAAAMAAKMLAPPPYGDLRYC